MNGMEFLTPELIQTLGSGAIFLVLFIIAWKRIEQKDSEMSKERTDKDQRIRDLTDKLTAKFEENTKINEGLKNALDNNTDVMQRVLDRFDATMRGGQNNNT